MLTINIIFVFVVSIVLAEQCGLSDNLHNFVTRGQRLTNHVIWSSKTKDIIECAQNCVRRNECQSINFNTKLNTCEISDVKDGYGGLLEKDAEYLYSEFSTWPSQIDPDCHERLCAENQVCVPGRIQKKESGTACSYICLDLAPKGNPGTPPTTDPSTTNETIPSSTDTSTTSGTDTPTTSETDTSQPSGTDNFTTIRTDTSPTSRIDTSTVGGTDSFQTNGTDTSTTSRTDTSTVGGTDNSQTSGTDTSTTSRTDTPTVGGTDNSQTNGTSTSTTSRTDTSTVGGTDNSQTSGTDTSATSRTDTSTVGGTDNSQTIGTDTSTTTGTDASITIETDTSPTTERNTSPTSGTDTTLTNGSNPSSVTSSSTSVTSTSEDTGTKFTSQNDRLPGSTDSINGPTASTTDSLTDDTISSTLTLSSSVVKDIGLVGGTTINSGRLELFDKEENTWRSVQLDVDVWNWKSTEVVCRQLGFSHGGSYHEQGKPFPAGEDGSFVMERLVCDGSEDSIYECQNDDILKSADNSQDIGITCFLDNVNWQGNNIQELNLQLITSEGRLNPLPSIPSIAKIEYNGTWTRVCGQLNEKAADVFCKTMYGSDWGGDAYQNDTEPLLMWTKNIACFHDDTPHPFYCMNEGWKLETCTQHVLLACLPNA